MKERTSANQSCSFLVVGDTHGNLFAIATIVSIVERLQLELDALLCVGDFAQQPPGDRPSFLSTTHFRVLGKSLALGSVEIMRALGKPVLFVPGNWDMPGMQIHGAKNIDMLCGKVPPSKIRAMTLLGIGGSRRIGVGFPYEWDDDTAWAQVRPELETHDSWARTVVLSHDVPIETRLDINTAGSHQGSNLVRALVETYHPCLLVCGHIHEGSGVDVIGRTLVINAGSVASPVQTSAVLSADSASMRAWREVQVFHVRVHANSNAEVKHVFTSGSRVFVREYAFLDGQLTPARHGQGVDAVPCGVPPAL